MTEETQQTAEQIAQESESAFANGFNAERGIEAPATPEPVVEQPKVETSAPVTEEKTEEVDEWAGVPAKVRAEFDSLREQLAPVTKIPDRLRTIEGHIGGLNTATKDLKAALAQAKTVTEAKGAEAPTQQEVQSAMRDPARWKQLKEDFPDWAEAMEPELADIRAKLDTLSKAAPPTVDTSALKKELEAQFNERLDARTRDAEVKARTYAYLDLKHGRGWEQKIGTPQFEDWYGKQPKDVKDLSASPDPEDASKLLGLYDAHLKRVAEKAEKDKRLERAVQPTGIAVTAHTEDPEDAFASGFQGVRTG